VSFLALNDGGHNETDNTGWVVEFLIQVRGGDAAKVGYVASGFWAGLTLGRLVLVQPTIMFGERKMVFLYIFLALALQLLYWFVPNVIADAVFVSLLGFVIGPFFPTGLSILTKLLRRELHTAAIGFSATFGQAGSAAFPFLTGAVASQKGVIVLQPIMVGLFGGMAILWALVPTVKRPTN
jgi:fucose permease